MIKIKNFYCPEDFTGGDGGAQPTVDPPLDQTVPIEDTPNATKTLLDSTGNIQPPADSQDVPPAQPENPQEPLDLVDYGFSEYETFNDNQEYFGELQKTFTQLGISPEQAPQLVELAENLIGPMKSHYDGLLSEFSPEKIGERIDAEFATMTQEERENMADLKVILERDLTPEGYQSFSGLLHTKADVATLVKLIKANASGPSQFRQGGNTGSSENIISLEQYRNEFDRIMENYDGQKSEEALTKLNERAEKFGDEETKKLISM